MKKKVLITIFILGIILMGTGATLYAKGTMRYLTYGQKIKLSKGSDSLLKIYAATKEKSGEQVSNFSGITKVIDDYRELTTNDMCTNDKFVGIILMSFGFILITSSLGLKFVFLK